ncbi:MAG TPA: tetratricopeptide repeat-containing protein kinase family protein, partial [Nannocystaceae bacterium]|nr:tetratricopeptide repeat-containing protein kinase family protein [Nannocystaceae bacterium]
NVMLGAARADDVDDAHPGRVLVLDFGLARAPDAPGSASRSSDGGVEETATDEAMASLTVSGCVVGTPLYMAPEQHFGQALPASDQFAFCVALYYGLFGNPPFSGDSVDELAAKKLDRHAPMFPSTSGVPRALRDVVRRGLAPDPDDRVPSMDALVDALERAARPRRRLALALGLAATTAVVVAAVPWLGSASATPCAAVDSALAGIWDPTRRDEVEHALAGSSYARETTATVLGRLDGYAAQLLAAQRRACETLQAEREPGDDAIDRELACLRHRKQNLAAMVDVLAAADARVGERAVDAVESLPAIATCDAGEAALPDDEGLRARIETAHRHASRVAALTGAGRYDEAEEEARALLDETAAIGHPPLSAEAEYLHAEVLHRLGEHEPAALTYRRAVEIAERSGSDELAARAWIGLLFATGHSLAQHERAAGYARHAEAAVQRAGSPPELEAELLGTLGTIAHDRGDYAAAQDLLERSIALRERIGEDAVEGSTLVNLGRTLASRGQLADGRATIERAIALIEGRYGPSHPIVAKTLAHLGALEFESGDYSAAKAHYEQALAIQRESLGPRHPEVAFSLNNVGNALVTERRLDEALGYYEQAREILREALGPDHPNVAKLTFNMAELAKQAKHMDRAQTEYRAAIAAFEHAHGHEHPDVGRALNNLASVQYDVGKYDESLANYEESLHVCERTIGRANPALGYPLTGVGLVHSADGRPQQAIAPLERALALRAKDDIDPVDRADSQ